MARRQVEQFRATIRKSGINPHVDVPARVSRVFAPYARAGRIRVEGALNGASIQGSLVPIGHGRHRLFVNGGMRAAAAVGVGDTVSFRLAATQPQQVRPPADVVAALKRVEGASAAFDRLSPSHRRELLRSVNDARTPETRKRRIEKIADQVLGTGGGTGGAPVPGRRAGGRARERALWRCPKCGNQFVNRNQWHSCARYDLSLPFKGNPPYVRALFDRWRKMVEACGRVRMLAYRNRVGFMVRVRFAGATPKKNGLDVGFWLPRRLDSPRFEKIETILPNVHLHRLRVTTADQLDAELAGWLTEAYACGCQKHLDRR